MTELEKALAGQKYCETDREVVAFTKRTKDLCFQYNNCLPSDPFRREILQMLVTGYCDKLVIEPGFNCIMGKNIHFEGFAKVNFNCTFLDCNIITVGDEAFIGPGCTFVCTNRSLNEEERINGVSDHKPIKLGAHTWIGAHTVVLPGITIGDNTVIGAGSVVTKDIPANAVAVGNPCRVIRMLDESDKMQ